jgi:hypothetical protein
VLRPHKPKIVTKSSTGAALVGVSDTASQAIHLRNLIIAQGYDLGPAVVYQDNMSCMALLKRGGPGSDRSRHISNAIFSPSRHINIRHFWLSESVALKEVVLEHLGTECRHVCEHPHQACARRAVRKREAWTNQLDGLRRIVLSLGVCWRLCRL